jgi:uncharacterized protein YndB with AHSA1/START domain
MRFLFVLGLLTAAPAAADIVDVGPSGLEIKHTAHIAAPPEKVWAALIVPAKWWSSDHTFSGSSSNITLDAKAGGCWCETLPNGGGVMHMTVSYLAPPKTLVVRGALGPFYNLAADGAMAFVLTANGAETDVTLTFRAGGYVREGFQKWAQPVDGVLAQQIANLKKHLEAAP